MQPTKALRPFALAFSVAAALSTTSGPARADSTIDQVLSAIANTYGSFQAGQFVLSLFGIGASDPFKRAISQLETFMRNYRDQTLVNNVIADLKEFQLISSDFMNGLTDNLEADFIGRAINDFAQLEGDINNGTMADAYQLGPAFNLLSVSFTGAIKAFGIQNPANAYPDSVLNAYFDETMATDYQMTGALLVNYDIFCPTNQTVYLWTQGGKTMWPKYAKGGEFPKLSPNPYICDLTLECNVESNLLQCCNSNVFPNAPNAVLPPAAVTSITNDLTSDRDAYFGDPSVGAVLTGIRGLGSIGHNVIVDYVPSFLPIGIGHAII